MTAQKRKRNCKIPLSLKISRYFETQQQPSDDLVEPEGQVATATLTHLPFCSEYPDLQVEHENGDEQYAQLSGHLTTHLPPLSVYPGAHPVQVVDDEQDVQLSGHFRTHLPPLSVYPDAQIVQVVDDEQNVQLSGQTISAHSPLDNV